MTNVETNVDVGPGATLAMSSAPRPGPGARISRSAGQGGGALVLTQLWQAFEWFGADTWTAEQSALRWPALTAAITLAIASVQNVWNWWTERRQSSVTVATDG